MITKKRNALAPLLLVLGLTATLSACGVVGNAVTSDKELARKAAFALDTTEDNVTISDRSGEVSGAINFVATTRGRKHQCYITTVMGAASSSAICSGVNSAGTAGNANCNALQKAGGQCK